MGRKKPYNHELEQAVLGALLLEREALTEVIEILKTETFDKEAHQYIFEAIRQLFERSEPVDLLTVPSQLRANGHLEKAGGAYYISQLTLITNSAANIVYHARLLQELAIKRSLIGIANETLRNAYDETSDVFDLLNTMSQSIFEVSELNIRRNYERLDNLISKAINELQTVRNQKDGLTGVPTGFASLDRVTSGWQRSDLVIVAARPGMGKTAFVLSIARNAAIDFKRPIALFSLEMSAVQLTKRLISSEAELESGKLKTGKMTEMEWNRMFDRLHSLSEAPIFIDDTPALSVLELRAKCRRLKARNDIQLVVIDYLQLMSADMKTKGNREQEIAYISRSLKQLAKELDVPVIALSQLSRAVETRGGTKRPQLSDLRESGSIEQDADMVIFLYRPEYYELTEDENGEPTKNVGEVIIAKHRNGSLENVRLKFINEFTKFTEWDEAEAFGEDAFGGGSFGSGLSSAMAPPAEMLTDNRPPARSEGSSTVKMSSRLNQQKTDGPPAPPPPDDEPPF